MSTLLQLLLQALLLLSRAPPPAHLAQVNMEPSAPSQKLSMDLSNWNLWEYSWRESSSQPPCPARPAC